MVGFDKVKNSAMMMMKMELMAMMIRRMTTSMNRQSSSKDGHGDEDVGGRSLDYGEHEENDPSEGVAIQLHGDLSRESSTG